jgi:hypothetical protein
LNDPGAAKKAPSELRKGVDAARLGKRQGRPRAMTVPAKGDRQKQAYVITGETVAAHETEPAALPEGSLVVRSAADLEKSDLPAVRLVAIWNALPGAKRIVKFKDRGSAAQRLGKRFAHRVIAETTKGLAIPR